MNRTVFAGVVGIVLFHATHSAADCTTAACTIEGARCSPSGSCSLLQTYEFYPDLSGLTEVTPDSPSNLTAASTTPNFVWTPFSGASLVAVAVFSSPPQFDPNSGDAIVNLQDIVWIWESALPGGSPTDTQAVWANGRGVQSSVTGILDPSSLTPDAPPALTPGIYYWGVWAWASDYSLTARSKVTTFVAGGDNITGTSCSTNCPGTAATRCSSASYCVIGCASDVDCYQEYTCDLSHRSVSNPWGVCSGPDTSCPCSNSSATCDPVLQLCYGGGSGSSQSSAACSCRGAPGAAEGGAWRSLLVAALLTGVRAWRRRARRVVAENACATMPS
jgi:hypothetical protein